MEKGEEKKVQSTDKFKSKARYTMSTSWRIHCLELYTCLKSHGHKSSTTMVTHKVTAMQELLPSEWKARSRYYRCFEELVGNKLSDLEVVSFFYKAYFTLTLRRQMATIVAVPHR
jgi:hypothetical protein